MEFKNDDWTKYGSRKFVVALLLVAAAWHLCAIGKMDGGHAMFVLGIAGGGYQLANVSDRKRSVDPS